MKKSCLTGHQNLQIVKRVDSGMKPADICPQYGIRETTHDKWKAKYGGVESSDIRRLRDFETVY